MINVQSPDFGNLPLTARRPYGTYYRPRVGQRTPVVSILTPFFNTDDVFLETIDVVFGQSFQNWEWIIVDDGSTAIDSLGMLASLADRDARVKVVRQANAGPAAARNRAFAASCGAYLCLLDSDDLIEPTYLEKCLWFLESQPAFGFCNSYSVIFGSEQYLWTTGYEQGRRHLKANSGPPISVLRRSTFAQAGGFDETITFGHEDWDFWLRAASRGIWGHTIPEYLQWYRKRRSGRFTLVMSDAQANADFEKLMDDRYGGLTDTFPEPRLREAQPFEDVEWSIPFENSLEDRSPGKSVLFLLPWMVTGGADRVNVEWIGALRADDWNVAVCTTLESPNEWQHEFGALTPDVFVLSRFLYRTDYVRFIASLIASRHVSVVVISASTLGYLVLPYLRSRFPTVAFVDLCHVEEPQWNNGGHPRFGAAYQDALDGNIVSTKHLKNWMVSRGADPAKIAVCYTGAAAPSTPRSAIDRHDVRARHGVPDDAFLVVFAGRLCAQKRPLMLLDILAQLEKRGCAFECVVVGDGELRAALDERRTKLGLVQRVRLVGNLAHVDWLQLLDVADVLLMPSAYEGISVALLEAMAHGVVPVVGQVGGQPEVVSPECGALISASDDELDGYVDAVEHYATHRDRWSDASAHSRARIAAHFSKQGGAASFIDALSRARPRAAERAADGIPIRLAQELVVQAFEYLRLASVADYLWARRHPGDVATASRGSAAPASASHRAARVLNRVRASAVGSYFARFTVIRRTGRRIVDWLERKPGFGATRDE